MSQPVQMERLPEAAYIFLPPTWVEVHGDLLPPVHDGDVFHYASPAGALAIVASNRLWASHALSLNDPTEREYGWRLIAERIELRRKAGHGRFDDQYEQVLESARSSEAWLPQPYVLSASTVSDDLTQYRLYGQVSLRLGDGPWRAQYEDVTRPGFMGDEYGVWRRVLYGKDQALPYIDRAIDAADAILDVDPADASDESLRVQYAMEILALHIKDEAYRDEQEVRMIFSLDDRRGLIRARSLASGALTTYVAVAPDPDADPREAGFFAEPRDRCVTAATLGPLAGGQATARALNAQYVATFEELSYRFNGDPALPIAMSRRPYRG